MTSALRREGAASIGDKTGVARVDREHAIDFAELVDELGKGLGGATIR